MKRKYANLILSIAVLFAVFGGFASRDTLLSVKQDVWELVNNPKALSAFDRIDAFIGSVEESTDNISYRNLCMDVNSLVYRVTHRQAVKQGEDTVVLLKNNYLSTEHRILNTEEEADQVAKIVKAFQNTVEKGGASFLYVQCPVKGMDVSAPAFATDYSKANYVQFQNALMQNGVSVLNLKTEMERDGLTEEEAFFITDHHWKPNTGLWASGKICRCLQEKYGFSFCASYNDISNYNVKTYNNCFLGATGQKVGRFFSPLGMDDIDLIIPKFETSFTEEKPFADEKKSGTFEETLVETSYFESDSLYGNSKYEAYCGGNYRLQIFKNLLNLDGKTFVVVRDSYGMAVLPFLALQAKEIHLADLRDFDWFADEKVDVTEYIKKIHPDYVLCIYSGGQCVPGYGKFDFNG